MDVKHWPLLAVFAGGCLTGAAFIALRSAGGAPAQAARVSDVTPSPSYRSEAPGVGEPARLAPMAASPEPVVPVAAPAEAQNAVGEHGTTPAEAGNSVADVLGRLEAEYRQQSAAAPTGEPSAAAKDESAPAPAKVPPPARAVAEQRSPVAEVAAAKLAVNERRVDAAAKPAEATLPAEAAAPSEALLAALPAKVAALVPEAANGAGAAQHLDSAVASSQQQLAGTQQQINVQIQQLTLQQNAIVQQFALMQYLQLYPGYSTGYPGYPTTGSSNRAAPYGGAQKPVRQPRITNSIAPSISATDNPWGFDLPPAPLVH